MRKSRYALVVDCHDGREVLYSSINRALAVVEGGFDAILRDPDEEEIKQLIDDEFIVNDWMMIDLEKAFWRTAFSELVRWRSPY